MKWTRRFALGLAALLTLTAIGIWEFVKLPDAADRLAALPVAGLNFASRELPLTTAERDIYGRARVLKRLYQVGRQRFALVVVDGSLNRHAVHDPLYCFRGAGWTVTATRDWPVRGGAARVVTLAQGRATAEAVYWFSDGATRHASAPRYWWQTALRRLSLGRSGPEPILVLVHNLEADSGGLTTALEQVPALFGL
jgi:hypothetical protein